MIGLSTRGRRLPVRPSIGSKKKQRQSSDESDNDHEEEKKEAFENGKDSLDELELEDPVDQDGMSFLSMR